MDAQEPTDLERVDDAIRQAHEAEARLLEISPGSINPVEEEAAPAPRDDDTAAEPRDDEGAAESDDEATPPDPAGSPRAPSDQPG